MRHVQWLAAFVFLVGGCGDTTAEAPNIGTGTEAGTNPLEDGGTMLSPEGGGQQEGGSNGPFDSGTNEGGTLGALTANIVSYLGGSLTSPVDDQGRDVAFDPQGNMYITGGLHRYQGTLFQGSASQRTFTGAGGRSSEDIFVVKVSPTGALVYATLIGGPNYDRPYALEVDAQGRAYVAGRAGAGFPTTPGALQTTFAGDNSPNGVYGTQDGVILRLDPTGALDWATYLGDPGPAFIRDIAVDAQGAVYAGVTRIVGTFPHVTAGTFGAVAPNVDHGALIKVASNGASVLWGTHLGGTALSAPSGGTPSVRVNARNEAFVIYGTQAPNEQVTAGAAQPAFGGGSDTVMVHVSNTGDALLYATYLGGVGDELLETHNLAIDAQDRAYAVVSSTSTQVPSVAGRMGYQPQNGGLGDALVVRLAANGKLFETGTFYGGSGVEHIEGIAYDARFNRVYISGTGTSFRTTDGTTIGASGSALVAGFDADLKSLAFASALGGSGTDNQFRSIAVDSNGAIGVTGQTNSTNIMTKNAIQSTYGGGGHDVLYARYSRP